MIPRIIGDPLKGDVAIVSTGESAQSYVIISLNKIA